MANRKINMKDLDQEQKSQIWELHKKGTGIREIANKFNIDAGCINNYIKLMKTIENENNSSPRVQQQLSNYQPAVNVVPSTKSVVTVSTTPQVETVKEEVPAPKKRRKYTDDDLLEICDLYTKLGSIDKVAKKYGCSNGTVHKIVKEMGLINNPRTPSKTISQPVKTIIEAVEREDEKIQQQEKKLMVTTNKTIVTVNFNEDGSISKPTLEKEVKEPFREIVKNMDIKCSYFRNRHETPNDVTEALFDQTGLENPTDFQYIDQTIIKFIGKNIKFINGIADRGIIAFPSGLQTITGSLVKICYEKKINLVLMHYNKDSFKRQDIFVNFEKSMNVDYSIYKRFFREFSKVFVTNEISDSFIKNTKNNLFIVVKSNYDDEQHQIEDQRECYICVDELQAFDLYRDLVLKYRNSPEKVGISLNPIRRDVKVDWFIERNISKYFNFSS